MSKQRRFSPEEKIQIAKEYLSGKASLREIGSRYGYTNKNGYPGCFLRWVNLYKEHGEAAFFHRGNSCYTKEFKTMVVEEYLAGIGSSTELAAKYKISNESILFGWIKLYNANKELEDYLPRREVYMAEARRKTTIEERKEIVEYCLSHNRERNIQFLKINELTNTKKNGVHRKMTIPHTKYGHSLNIHFRYLTCLLDRGHINMKPPLFY